MGVVKSNSGGGGDYATGEWFFEFHRKIVVPKSVFDAVNERFIRGDYDEAAELLKARADANAHEVIDLFTRELKAQGGPQPDPTTP